VKKYSEGYFVSNLGQEATLAWLYEYANLRQSKSLMGLSLSQFTCTHMAVKKCSEGYFVSNLGQEANLAWLYEQASLKQRQKPYGTLPQPVHM
jgi:hypothetical protein